MRGCDRHDSDYNYKLLLVGGDYRKCNKKANSFFPDTKSGIVCLFLLVLIIAMCLNIYVNAVPAQFPVWIESIENEVNGDVRLSLAKLTYGERYDTIVIQAENLGETYISYGMDYHIEFLQNETWYTVYFPELTPLISIELDPYGKRESAYTVIHGLFDIAGTYRIYVDTLGYCELALKK